MKHSSNLMKAVFAMAIIAIGVYLGSCRKSDQADPSSLSSQQSSDVSTPILGASKAADPSVVFPVQAHMFGKSYAEWGAALFQWTFQFDTLHSPYLDTDGSFQDQGQSGKVFFLAGARFGTINRSVTVPAGKSILIPLIYRFANTGCGETVDQLLGDVAGPLSAVDGLSLSINGVQLKDMASYKTISGIFKAAGNAEWSQGTSTFCIDGSTQQVIIGGYWVILKPLAPGTYTIHTTGGISVAGLAKDVTWTITQQ